MCTAGPIPYLWWYPVLGVSFVHDNAPSMDTPAGQICHGIVDLLKGVALGHQRGQVKLATFIPADKGGEITVRPTQAAACPGIGALGNAEFLHINAPQFLDGTHQTRRAAFLEADSSRPRGVQDLLLGARGPNGVNGVVHSAVCQRMDALDRVTVRRIDPMRGSKTLRKGQLIVAQVHGDDRPCTCILRLIRQPEKPDKIPSFLHLV
jgi:hypothetical protein